MYTQNLCILCKKCTLLSVWVYRFTTVFLSIFGTWTRVEHLNLNFGPPNEEAIVHMQSSMSNIILVCHMMNYL